MAGGLILSNFEGKEYPGKLTLFVVLTCLVAATGGLIIGYDIGISEFFSSVYKKKREDKSTNQYCKFDSQLLTTFTSSLYLAAQIASIFASFVTRNFGRRWSMFISGISFLIGAAINGAAQDVFMLIFGRILLGVGVGFASQSIPLYLSEMAPAKLRGTLNITCQLMITIGIFFANLINYSTSKIQAGWGWRLSLALAAVSALIITVGSLFLPDTPNSLIERGHDEKAKIILQKIRGTKDISEEYADLVAAGEQSKQVKHPWANILKQKYGPHLTMAILIPFFQQLTGINVIMFYATILFETLGFGNNTSLMSTVIIGLVNVFATFVSIGTVDCLGRRLLFLQGGFQMLICQITLGTLVAIKFGSTGEGTIPKTYALFMVLFICIYVAGFAWSWGPLGGTLVPSEILPLEIQSAGQSINVAVSMLFTFVVAQMFLPMLCHFKFGLFYFFGGWDFIMTFFIAFFLPETKTVPIEKMILVWKSHWFWGRFVRDEDYTIC